MTFTVGHKTRPYDIRGILDAEKSSKNLKNVKFRMKCFDVSQKMLNFVIRCCTNEVQAKVFQ